jgi:hypothetical protein
VRAVLVIAGIALLALGCYLALSSPTPEGYEPDIHGSNAICSSAILEVFGFGSEDTNTAASPGGDGVSIGIDDCKNPARRQSAVAAVAIAVGAAALVVRRRIPSAPAAPIGG